MDKAVIDRIEGELAVLLVGDDERELTIPLRELPKGSGPGVWLKITLEGGTVRLAEIDSDATHSRQARIQKKMNRLLGKQRNAG